MNMSQSSIRKVSVLNGRVKKQADEMGLNDDDHVLVETEINEGEPPDYELTKIEGSPTEFIKEHIFSQEGEEESERDV